MDTPLPKKFFCIAMIKNEADCIESFVRYHAPVFDGMVFLDNGSTDETLEILAALADEGLPIYVRKDADREYRQAEKTSALLHDTLRDYAPDVIAVLDADEFLFLYGGGNPRAQLEALLADTVYYIASFEYRMCGGADSAGERFLPKRLTACQRQSAVGKVLITSSLLKHYPFGVTQGNHDLSLPCGKESLPLTPYLLRETTGKTIYCAEKKQLTEHLPDLLVESADRFRVNGIPLQRVQHEQLALAHFPYRSAEQTLSKVFVGRINVVSRAKRQYEIYSPYCDDFIRLQHSRQAAHKYLYTPPEGWVSNPLDLSYHSDLTLRYTPQRPVNYLANVLNNSLQLAEDYARQREEAIALQKNLDKAQSIMLPLLLDCLRGDFSLERTTRALWQFPAKQVVTAISALDAASEEQEALLNKLAALLCRYYDTEKVLVWLEKAQ